MNLRTELQYTLSTFIGFMLESICYGKHCRRQHLVQTLTFNRRLIGIYCVIFAAFVRIQLKRTNNTRSKALLLYLVTANFIACTAYLAVDVIASQPTACIEVSSVSNALYSCIDLISQSILVNFLTYDSESVSTTDASGFPFSIKIYQCWIIWRQPWVMVVPCVLTLAILGANLLNLD